MATPQRLFPLQRDWDGYPREKARIPESVHMAAYEVYAEVCGPQAALIDFEAGCRGGFGTGELIAFLYARSFPRSEWRKRFDEALYGMKLR
jgi:hypothetical protein